MVSRIKKLRANKLSIPVEFDEITAILIRDFSTQIVVVGVENTANLCGSCPSGQDFACSFLQTPPRDDALAVKCEDL